MRHILVVAPHHDDESGCGGTIAKVSLQEDIKVSIAVVLNGVSGVTGVDNKQEAMAIRKKEAVDAGNILGVSEFHFLDFEDRGFVYSQKALHAIIRLIRQCFPVSIWFPHEDDGDIEHKVVHQLVKEASWISSTPYLPELGSPVEPIKQLLCYEVWTPLQKFQIRSDISSTVEKKRKAMACYKSQLKQANYDKAILGLNRYRAGMFSQARYVEAFEVLSMPFWIPG